MPTAAAELKRMLGEFNQRHGADLSMVITRTGVPIAHEGPGGFNADTFANLASTLMNAAEVMYTVLSRAGPTRIVVESENGSLVASGLGSKAVFVALGGKRDEILRGMDDITAGIRQVLGTQA